MEYKSIINASHTELMLTATQLAKQGWKIINVVITNHDYFIAFLKRKI